MEFNLINFSPFATNVIDCIEVKNLYTRTLKKVTIDQFTNFVIKFDGITVLSSDDNIQVSYFLNCAEVGYIGNKIIK